MLVIALLVLVAALTDPGRRLIVLGVLVTAPGLAITQLAGIRDLATKAILVVPVSLAADMLIATIFLYLGVWSPVLILAVIVACTVAAFVITDHIRAAVAGLVLVGMLPTFVVLAGGR